MCKWPTWQMSGAGPSEAENEFQAYQGNQSSLAKRSQRMKGNPKECRQEALQCSELSVTAPTEQDRQAYANLARAWFWLADGFETLRPMPGAGEKRRLLRNLATSRVAVSQGSP